MMNPALKKLQVLTARKETVIDRFLRYVTIDTQSSDDAKTTPSTMKQHNLAKLLYEELKAIGLKNVYYDETHCYVYAHLEKSKGANSTKTLALIAHMDTSPACSGENVKPRIVKDYRGEEIVLNKAKKISLTPAAFPELLSHMGEDLIVTDGTTLLGADDKCGVAEIMTVLSYLKEHEEISHPAISVCFTPDEEVGSGAEYLDFKRLKADFAYTVDGGKLGELEYECFNAAACTLTFHGISVHTGTAKDKLLNASLLAYEFQSMLPAAQVPEHTEKREGFYFLDKMQGDCEEAKAHYIIRDHDAKKFSKRKKTMLEIAAYLNKKYGHEVVSVSLEDSYYNLLPRIKPHFHLIKNARKAMKALDITPIEEPIRGGTDGARLSYRGLPCPNLCTGGYNFHSRFEFASVQEMHMVVLMLLKIVELYAQ